jgi:hypothetical protein
MIWDEILKTSVDYRWLSGMDVNGYPISYPYDPTTPDTTISYPTCLGVTGSGYTGTTGASGYSNTNPFVFQGVGSLDANGDPNLDEIVENFNADKSLDDLRTSVTILGQDINDRSLLLAHNAENENTMLYSVDDPTFLGFRCPFVDISPEYIDQTFMNSKAQVTADQAGIPALNASFSAWFQPNLSLFDVFGISEPIAFGSTIPYFRATGITNQYSVSPSFGSNFYGRTNIQAKYIGNI